MHKAKKDVWTILMDEWKSTKEAGVHFGWDGHKSRMHLACPIVMAKVLEVSFDL